MVFHQSICLNICDFVKNGRVMKPQISGVKINKSPRVVFFPEASWVLMLVQHV